MEARSHGRSSPPGTPVLHNSTLQPVKDSRYSTNHCRNSSCRATSKSHAQLFLPLG
jgi:hypothetical protein